MDNADYLISGEKFEAIIKSVENIVKVKDDKNKTIEEACGDMWVMAHMLLSKLKKIKGGCDE